MAVLGSSYFDLIDLYKSLDPKGQIAPVIEMLAKMTPVVEDSIAIECNKGTSHQHTVRTGLPDVAWGELYKGISQSKSRKAQVTDTTGFVEGLSTVDERLLKLSDNQGAVRLSEAQGYLEAMSQEFETKFFYGNTATDPKEFMGLAPRFNSITAKNGNQIIDAGGTGSDNTSVWFVTWGENTCHLLYPKGTKAGVTREDMGRQRVLDSSGDPYFAMEEMFSWHCGLAVKDWRFIVRIANIDVSNMKAGSVNMYNLMRKAYYQFEGRRRKGMGKTVIYMNSDVLETLDAEATNAGASDNFIRLKTMEVEGREIKTYRGIPIRETDSILNTEARVV